MRRRISILFGLAVVALLVAAPSALAFNDGRGFYGPTDDKVNTFTGFIVIAFFPLLVFVLSMIQWRLDKRKESRKKARKHLQSAANVHGGW